MRDERHERNDRYPPAVIRRLPLYLRELEGLDSAGTEHISSRDLAERLDITDSQVRKDLGLFGQFGRRGVGYRVAPLAGQIRRILGTDKPWNVVLVGAGNLGQALLRYRGFARKGFRLVAAFDLLPGKLGWEVGEIPVHHIEELPAVCRMHAVRLAIVSVPSNAAQQAVDALAAAGVRGVLNFAPAAVHAPPGVSVRMVDLAAQLEELAFLAGEN